MSVPYSKTSLIHSPLIEFLLLAGQTLHNLPCCYPPIIFSSYPTQCTLHTPHTHTHTHPHTLAIPIYSSSPSPALSPRSFLRLFCLEVSLLSLFFLHVPINVILILLGQHFLTPVLHRSPKHPEIKLRGFVNLD